MNPPIVVIVKSIVRWASCLSLAVLVIPCFLFPLALLGPHSKTARALFYKSSSLFSKSLLTLLGVKLQILHAQNLCNIKQPSIIIMNHASALDIPVLEAFLAGRPFVWFSKITYSSIPFVGTILKRMHTILSKKKQRSAATSLSAFIDKATRYNAHMLIFPEGTRSLDGTVKTFMPGFALAAEISNRSVVPIMAYGLNSILPKHSFLIDSSRNKIKIFVGKPLERFPDESRDAFITRVHDTCTEMLATISGD